MQSQTEPSTPADLKKWSIEHPEFKRENSLIISFEDKLLFLGGWLPEQDRRVDDLILVDPESQKFQVIPSTGDNLKYYCFGDVSACYWKDSKIVVFGGSHVYGNETFSTIAVITLKDLDSDHPSAHWETVENPTRLFKRSHEAYIYEDKMYVLGGYPQEDCIRCLDLISWTWSQCNFTGKAPENYHSDSYMVFHENKAYVFVGTAYSRNGEVPVIELDFDTRSLKRLAAFEGQASHSWAHTCPQLIDGKAYVSITKTLEGGSYKQQVWTYDISSNNWSEFKAAERLFSETPSFDYTPIFYCNDHLIFWRGYRRRSSSPVEFWSLPLNTSKAKKSSANITQTQQALKDFFFEAPYSDISFEVESEIIKAHKWWLIQKNKFFANMFASGMSEAQASKIKITDMKAPTFKALLEFLYSENVELDNNLALELLQQADKYSVDELKKACEKHLIANIEPENYVALGNIAELIGTVALREAVVLFIAKNMKKIKQRKDFNEISDALLRDSIVKFTVK